MKFFLVISQLLCYSITNAQLSKFDVSSLTIEDTLSKAKSICKLRHKAILVFAYRTYTTWNCSEPYNIIALMKDRSIKSFKFSLPNLLVSQISNPDSLKYTMRLVYSYDLFSMKTSDNWVETCESNSPSCGDCAEYDFVIMTKEKNKRLYFYAPTLYVGYCTSVNQNKRIIDFIKQLWN